jgi:hypothetical protein
MADALERALPDIPDHDTLTDKTVPSRWNPANRCMPTGTMVNPLDWFSGGGGAAWLRAIIAFCRGGEFEVW